MISYKAVDYQTAGEPFRIVIPPWQIPGDTVAGRRAEAINDPDTQLLRRTLCHEPRGHADMYGGFIVPADDEGAQFGVLFWHKDGFSTACGHGTIALGAWAVESGLVPAEPDGTTEVIIDVPSGRVKALVHMARGKIRSIDFVNVPSYVVGLNVNIQTSAGPLSVDVGYGGAIYAHVNAAALGLSVEAIHLNRMIELGREIRDVLNGTEHAKHRDDDRINGIYGVIFYDDHGGDAMTLKQTNVTVFADGQVDRSPCGSGTASRVAVLSARGLLTADRVLDHRSIVGSQFKARITKRLHDPRGDRVVPVITGNAYITGRHEFIIDERDDLGPGFVLR